MLDTLVKRTEERPAIRRAAALEGDEARDIALVERAVAQSIREAVDWGGEIDLSPAREVEREELVRQRIEFDRLFRTPTHQTLEYNLWPGWQMITPIYDRWWAVGTGMPWAHVDGHMTVMASDGFSASGFGFYLEAEQEGLVSIAPHGPGNSSWIAFKDAPRLRSTAGAGAVVYDGSNLIVSRQPVMWDVVGPKAFKGGADKRAFGDIASPPVPNTFGTVPISPVLAPIGPGRRLLVWFYHWHVGANMEDAGFLSFIASEVPTVFLNFGKGPFVH